MTSEIHILVRWRGCSPVEQIGVMTSTGEVTQQRSVLCQVQNLGRIDQRRDEDNRGFLTVATSRSPLCAAVSRKQCSAAMLRNNFWRIALCCALGGLETP